jgi:putative mRNA 3-end processing factor
MLGLDQSLKEGTLYLTPATKQLLEVLRGPLPAERIRILEYNQPVRIGDEILTLLPSDHILGSCQVKVEDAEGKILVYTGDFRLPNTPILEADELVIEATYGNPKHRRVFKEKVEDELEKLVRQALRSGPVFIFGYHGKVQELLSILRQRGVTAPALMSRRVYEISKVCERFGMKLGEFLVDESKEGMEVEESGEFIGVYSMRSRHSVHRGGIRIYLSGWEFEKPIRQISATEYLAAFSDHADFDGLMEYVEQSRPKYVVTDNFRVGDAPSLAREIRKRFGIRAEPLPK